MNAQDIDCGMKALALIDKDIEYALTELGPPPPRHRPQGFETFLSTIISQQISTEVARVIMDRVTALVPDMTATGLLHVDDQALRDAGLSWRKIEYAKGLAEAVYSGRFDVDGLADLSDEKAIEAIMELRGFGRWSAEIYLMFSLKRSDIFPADDLALLVALGRLKGLSARPTPKQARDLVEHWSPWRSVGSLFLWHYYRGAPT
ncbi:DNA-3-methyladenine glycosylase family protein [Marinobacterium iners]|uniref:DNA-3-methyladenine glycosylase II n=1 Tax=Marinobacterium iners DSM 11526 TaxID=1122198 RepID=A0A1H4GNL6_9GAMM|nr:DNA-3-methyladenine glycosylase [Marinobacterium iners]SEB10600.1 DNA-3-methyladenine glycosylase II [Marinobacterium iners DSM 11526]